LLAHNIQGVHCVFLLLYGDLISLDLFSFCLYLLTNSINIDVTHEKSILNSTFIPHMIFIGVHVSVFNFEFLPLTPESLIVIIRVWVLTNKLINGSGSIDFSKLSFQITKTKTQFYFMFFSQKLNSFFKNGSGFGDSQKLTHFSNVNIEIIRRISVELS